MKILIINHYALPPDEKGGRRHVMMARALAKRGHEVTIIACPFHYQQHRFFRDVTAPTEEMIDGVRFIWIPARAYQGNGVGRMINMVDFSLRLRRFLKGWDWRPDRLYASTPHLLAPLMGQLWAARHRIPFILEVRDLWPQSFVDLKILRAWHPLCLCFGWLERYLYRKAGHIVTLLNNSADYIRTHGGAGRPVTILPNMVDEAEIPAITPPPQNGAFTVLYAGSHGYSNNLSTLLDAAQILSNRPDIRFICIGDGQEREKLIASALHRGLKNIVFHPAMDKQDMYQEMQCADAYVLLLRDTPLYRWGISMNKLFDYMLMARPTLLAGDAPGNPLELSGGGVSCAPEDPQALAQAIVEMKNTDPQTRLDMGGKARAYVVDHHGLQSGLDRLEQVMGKG